MAQDLDRFNFLERIVHWVVGTTFVVLVLTGLAFSYPSLFWLTIFVGGGAAARVIHPWMGFFFSAALVVMFFIWIRDMWIGKADVEWLKALRQYTFHQKDQVPDTGKYNGGQKLFFWIMVVFGLAHLFTGIPLWAPEGYSAGTLSLMRFIHYLVTLPGVIFLIAHIYLGTLAFPGTARGMVWGKVSRAWAKRHHPLWKQEETGA